MKTAAQFEFTSDELVLLLVCLIQVVNPSHLRQGPDGITVDLESLRSKKNLSPDELLLLKLRAALDTNAEANRFALPLSPEESRRLVGAVHRVEALRDWPEDVRQMGRALCTRLNSA